MEVAFGLPAGFSVQILWSNSLDTKVRRSTTPYLTAEPVVTSAKIDPTKPSFLIIATDGLWNMLSSQQGVGLVGKWLEPQAAENPNNNKSEPAYDSFDFGHFWK